MNAEAIAKGLAGHRSGSGWVARCPAHDDHNPSLSISDSRSGKVLIKCHTGCEQTAVIEALRERHLWKLHDRVRPPHQSRKVDKADSNNLRESDSARSDYALGIWKNSVAATGTKAEDYLRSRKLTLSIPEALRFLGATKHPSGGFWPAIVALITDGLDDKPIAIHRTFLDREGNGKAPVAPPKMMLGPVRGGVVKLAPAEEFLMIGEGIETCLSAMQATGKPAWAALSTSGMANLELPPLVKEVVILADADEAGRTAALKAARRWIRQGRITRIAEPPEGLDFNDLLLGHHVSTHEGEDHVGS